MDIGELHERALARVGRLVEGVGPDRLGAPTPCDQWDVRALLAHLVGGNHRAVGVAEGRPLGRPGAADDPAAQLGDDPAVACLPSAAALTRAWREPGRLDGTYRLPFGELPGRAAVQLHLLETVMHGWDLARATGQDPGFDDDVVAAAADGAAPVDRLAAFLGRQP